MKGGDMHLLKAAKSRKLLKDLQRRLKAYEKEHDVPDEPTGYRTAADSGEPRQVVLDSRESREVRVAAFAELTAEEQKAVVEGLAEDEMRRVFVAHEGLGA